MDYPSDSRAHDSGYFTPSPDKENKLSAPLISYPQLENLNNCILSNTNIRNTKNIDLSKTTNIGNNHDMDRPPHSYIALISMAILSKIEKKILLNEIYDWVVQNFPYYQHRTDKSWRNSIRHNLSLNECFIKVGKAGNGRGYYWSIHPANMNDFKKGDFRRRQARLRAKHDKPIPITNNNINNTNTNTTSSNTNINNSNTNNNDHHNINITNSNNRTSRNVNNDCTDNNINNNNNNNQTNNNINTINMLHNNSNLNIPNHYLETTTHHQTQQINNLNTTPTSSSSSTSSIGSMQNTNLCSPSAHHHHHHQLINNDINNTTNYHPNMNLNCISSPVSVPVSHNLQTMPSSVYHSHHHSSPTQQSHHHHQYNYVAATFPWLPAAAAAAAAQQIQTSTNNFLESFTSSALACGYNSIIPHSYSTTNEMSNDNTALYYHNFHNK